VEHSRRHAGRSGRLASPRFRRRIVLTAGALLAAGGVAAAALIIGNTAAPPLPVTNRPPIVDHKRKPVRLSAAERKDVVAVSRLFLATAVRRNHPERAWPLATAALRGGTTLADWKAGTLPFPPYPVLNARWNLAYSVVGEVGLDVLVESTDPQIRPLVHRLTLVRSPRPAGPSWLVDGWMPMASSSIAPADSPTGFDIGTGSGANTDTSAPSRSTPDPSRYWLLTPFVVLLAALFIPIVLLADSRRAERRIRRMRANAQRQG
jgi:hypothetical protein